MKTTWTRAAIVAAGIALAGFGAAEAQTSHTMDGTVTKVDAKKGWVDVKTSEGSMKLHFPSTALENVKKGDSVTVQMSMATSPGAATTGTKRSADTTTKNK